ncbi:hypothetical protein CKO44_17615 [Rubrivivax gelatinosus]|uniref:universal stress protein n=1 Tax=Rubrivivax gelatinosus TaxID=28068 RepID=UPI001907EC5B|nr:universal stress protein [Rubrivivax gelatinosus]MBK1615281.1 hypothetical protein [Rubrivivax gelatinosus]
MHAVDNAGRRFSALDPAPCPIEGAGTSASASPAPLPLALPYITVLGDLSDASDTALRRAAGLAAAHGARLRLLAFGALGDAVSAEQLPRLRWKARRIARLYQLPIEVGDTPARLSDLRAGLRPGELVVTHQRRASGLLAAWRGGAAAALAGRLPVPLLVVNEAGWRPYRQVLAAVDLLTQPECLARWACTVAGEAEVELLHVLRQARPGKARFGQVAQPGLELDLRRHAAALQRVVQSLGPQATRVRPTLALGDEVAAEILLRQPDTGDALIVIGRSTEAPWLDVLLGSVARSVLRATPHDVLVVPLSPGPGHNASAG